MSLTSPDWRSLEHAYGDASDIPVLLEQLRSPKKNVRRDALTSIDHAILHQGGGYSAAPAVAPFLVELVADPSVQDRAPILNLLARLGEEHRWNKRDLKDAMFRPHASYVAILDQAADLLERTYHATRAGVPVYLELLNDGEVAVRREAAHLVAWFEEDRALVLPKLLAAHDAEHHGEARAAIVLALGVMWRHTVTNGEPVADALRAAIDEAFRSTDRVLVIAAAIARAFSSTPPDEATLHVLADAFIDGPDTELAWCEGYLGKAAGDALAYLHRRGDARARPLAENALATIAAEQRGARDAASRFGSLASRALETLLEMYFYGGSTGPPWSAEQRRFLVWLVENGALEVMLVDQSLRQYGLPEIADLPAALGVAPAPPPPILTRSSIAPLVAELPDVLLDVLPASDVIDLVEVSFKRDLDPARLERLRALTLGLTDHVDGRAAVARAAMRLAAEGALLGTRFRRYLFHMFAVAAAAVPSVSEEIVERLLLAEPEVFEFTDLEPLRPAIVSLSDAARLRVIPKLKVNSFAEPDEAWPFWDLVPSPSMAKKLLALMRGDDEPFFLGAGAAKAVDVLAAQGAEAAPLLAAAAAKTKWKPRTIAFAALARLEGADLAAFTSDEDPRIAGIATKVSKGGAIEPHDELALGIDPSSTDRGRRPKGGVVGRDGKPWRG